MPKTPGEGPAFVLVKWGGDQEIHLAELDRSVLPSQDGIDLDPRGSNAEVPLQLSGTE
ncbi:MAG: hypothetical protein H0T58_07815 [Gemmatimonadales bacterium]|nr:hypothetical protein [Gemmatimonadales bacterium]